MAGSVLPRLEVVPLPPVGPLGLRMHQTCNAYCTGGWHTVLVYYPPGGVTEDHTLRAIVGLQRLGWDLVAVRRAPEWAPLAPGTCIVDLDGLFGRAWFSTGREDAWLWTIAPYVAAPLPPAAKEDPE